MRREYYVKKELHGSPLYIVPIYLYQWWKMSIDTVSKEMMARVRQNDKHAIRYSSVWRY
jgi:hypothetical protein